MLDKIKSFLLCTRMKSLYWRTGAWFAVGVLNMVMENLSGFGLSPAEVTFLGLILGEVTKALNNFLQGKTA